MQQVNLNAIDARPRRGRPPKRPAPEADPDLPPPRRPRGRPRLTDEQRQQRDADRQQYERVRDDARRLTRQREAEERRLWELEEQRQQDELRQQEMLRQTQEEEQRREQRRQQGLDSDDEEDEFGDVDYDEPFRRLAQGLIY